MVKTKHFYYQISNYNNQHFKPYRLLDKAEFCKKFDKTSDEYDNTEILHTAINGFVDSICDEVKLAEFDFTNKKELLELIIEELQRRVC